MIKITLFFILISISSLLLAENVDDKIKSNCGTHPVISYLRDYKGYLMDPQIIKQAEECAKGEIKADVWKWKLADANIQGCLQKKYGHEESYIKVIARQFEDAEKMVGDQISSYNACATNIRNCGRHPCKTGPPSDGMFLPPDGCADYDVSYVEEQLEQAKVDSRATASVHNIVKRAAIEGTFAGWVAECGRDYTNYNLNHENYLIKAKAYAKYKNSQGKECRKVGINTKMDGRWLQGTEAEYCLESGKWKPYR